MKKRLLVMSVGLVGSVGTVAHAELNLTPDPAGVLFDAGQFIWQYRVTLSPGSALRTNATVAADTVRAQDFVTLFDVAGYQPGSASFAIASPLLGVQNPTGPYGFTITANATGVTPANTLPDDLPALTNLTLAISGTLGVNAPTLLQPTGAAPVLLGTLSFRSVYGPGVLNFSDFASQTVKISDSTTINAIGSVVTPAVPEPSSALMVLPAVAALGLRRRRRA